MRVSMYICENESVSVCVLVCISVKMIECMCAC